MKVFVKYYDLSTHSLLAANVLHPRVKFEHFRIYSSCAGHESVAEAAMRAWEELQTFFEVGLDANRASSVSRSQPADHDELLQEPFSVDVNTTVIGNEFTKYNDDKVEAIVSDLLKWWKHNERRYPTLGKAAHDY